MKKPSCRYETNSEKIIYKGRVFYGDSEVNIDSNKENTIYLHRVFAIKPQIKQMYIQAVAENETGEKDIEYNTLYLDIDDFEGDTIVNWVKTGDTGYFENFLGFFDYNRSDFLTYNRDVINDVKQALASGKKVEFLPLTDNLGSEEHNSKLANSRLNSAYSLIGTKNGITPVFPLDYIFPNENPSGRILNRSVIVRIYK